MTTLGRCIVLLAAAATAFVAAPAVAAPAVPVQQLRVSYVPFPDPHLSNYHVAGRYPQVSSTGVDTRRVNASLTRRFVAYERAMASARDRNLGRTRATAASSTF